jgi:hypothetical protein
MTSIALRPKLLAASALAAGLLALPAAADAATNFGSRLNHDPANSGECTSFPTPCTIASFIHPSDPNGDPYSGGAPGDGVITKFRIRAFGEGNAAATVTFRLADVRLTNPPNDDSALATAAGTGPTVKLDPLADPTADTPVREFAGRLSVKKGQHLALDGTNVWATVNNSGDKFSYVYNPTLVDGQGARGSNSSTGELLVAAVIEPDSDHDGFGDETQDKCPTEANGGAACSSPDVKDPSLRYSFSPTAFPAQASGPSLLGRTFGTRITYRLSETATVTFKVQRALKGRRIRGRCRPATRRNKLRSRRKCKRYKTVRGSFKKTGGAGSNSVRFTGRLRNRRLKVGRYRMVATAVDPAGNKSKAVRHAFRIIR